MMKLVLLAALVSGFGGSSERILTSYYLHLVGMKPLHTFGDIVPVDSVVFIKSSNYSIDVLSISNPPAPYLLKRFVLYRAILSFSVKDHYLFALQDFGNFDSIVVYDLSNPDTLVKVAVVPSPWSSGKIKIYGDYLLIINRSSGVYIMDISDPTNPIFVSEISLRSPNYDVLIYRNYLIIARGSNGVWIYDISDPSNPTHISTFRDSSNSFESLAIHDSLLFTGETRIYILDLSDPANPDLIARFSPYAGRFVEGFTVLDTLLFIAVSLNRTFQVYNISDPANPEFLVEAGSESSTGGLFIKNHYVFTKCWYGIFIYDISDLLNPALVSRYLSTPVPGVDITVDGNMVYLVDYNYGFRVLDFSDPTRGYERGYYKDFSTFYRVVAKDSFAYVYYSTYTSSGIKVFDVRIPENPTVVTSFSTGGSIEDIAIKDTFLYILRHNRLKIYSIGNRGNPVLVGTVDSLSWSQEFCLSDSFAYILSNSGSRHIVIVNISDPVNPYIVGEFDTTGFAPRKIALQGNYLYAVGYYGGNFIFYVVDISNPTSPVLISQLSGNVPTTVSNLVVRGHLAYIFAEPSPIFSRSYIINVADPYNPVTMGYAQPADDAEVKDSLIFLLESSAAILVTKSIEIPTAELVYPVDTIINDTLPEFVWSVNGIHPLTMYKIYIYSDNGYRDSGTVYEDTVYVPATPLSDGVYHWQVVTMSPSGWFDYSDVGTFIVDAGIPAIPAIISPADGEWLSDTLVHLQWTGVSRKGTPVHYIYEIFWDTVLVVSDTVDTNEALVNLNEGFYSWRVMAFDEAGNSSDWSVDSFGVDVTQPVIDSVSFPGDTVFDSVSIRVFAHDELSGISDVTLFYWIDETPDSFAMTWDSTCYRGSIPVDSGVHHVSFFVRVKDNAGNAASSDTLEIVFIGIQENCQIAFSINLDKTLIYRDSPVLRVSLPQESYVELTIYDLAGRLVRKYRIKGSKGTNSLTVHGIKKPGIYFIRAKTKFGERLFKIVRVK